MFQKKGRKREKDRRSSTRGMGELAQAARLKGEVASPCRTVPSGDPPKGLPKASFSMVESLRLSLGEQVSGPQTNSPKTKILNSTSLP